MKKVSAVIALALFVAQSGYAAADQLYQNAGSFWDVGTSSNYVVSVNSYTLTTFSGIARGVIVKYQPVGNSIFESKSDTSTLTTTGVILSSGTVYSEDKYFGKMYFKVMPGVSTQKLKIEWVGYK